MTKEDLINLKKQISELSDEEKKQRDLYLRELANGTLQGPPTGYASIDKPWLKYYKVENIENSFVPEMSIIQFAKLMNKRNMNKVALELLSSVNNFSSGIKITYKDFFKRINKLSSAMKQYGVKNGDVVCTILPNIPESRIIIYALNTIGAIAYPINFMLPPNSMEKIIKENNVNSVFVFSQFYDKYSAVFKKSKLDHVIYINGKESLPTIVKEMLKVKDIIKGDKNAIPSEPYVVSYDEYLKNGKNEIITPVYDKDKTAIIVGTSGTTGNPKGACLTNEALNAIAVQHLESGAYEYNSILLDILIQSIAYGVTAMHAATCAGFYTELIPELVTDRIPSILSTINPAPDYFIGGPVHAINISNSDEFKNGSIHKLKHFVSGGATLDKKIEETLNGVSEGYSENGIVNENIFVRNGFGATENGGCGTFAVEGAYKFGGIGIPLVLDNISIFELGTENELGYCEIGEICISGPTIMKEYLNNESETNVLKLLSELIEY